MNMNRIVKFTLLVTAIGFTSFISSCSDEEEAPTKNAWELVSTNSNLTIFKAQVEAASLSSSLEVSGTDKVTVFAPSDAAMLSLLKTLFGETATDPALFNSVAPAVIQAVIKYHIVASQTFSSGLTNNLELTTLQGEKIKVVVTSTGEKKLDTGASSDAAITTADIKATNGVIHIVDVVLVPPTIGNLIIQTLGKVAQPILLSSSFSTLSAAIQKADAGKASEQTIVGALVSLSNVTVFAPVNDVFTAGSITVDTYTAAEWDAIIRGHIVPETLTTLSSGTKNTINSKVITIAVGTTTTVKGTGNASAVPIVSASVAASNGLVYPIGGVLVHQ